jgi:uncharacterized damage-inducible protein DinB
MRITVFHKNASLSGEAFLFEADDVAALSESELEQNPDNVPASRWQVLMQLVNHGTDHRATILQALHALEAPTFEQDFILWLWHR